MAAFPDGYWDAQRSSFLRSTNSRNFVGSEAKAPESLQFARARLATVQNFRKETLKDSGFKADVVDAAAIQKTGEEFDRAAAELSRLYAVGNFADAARVREEKLLPAFDQNMTAIGKAADAVEAQSLSASKDYTTKTHSRSEEHTSELQSQR